MTAMRYFSAAIILVLLTSQPALAKMYKWVDEKGITHYGDSIPAQYAPRGNTELSKGGAVLKKTDAALTPEQIKVKEEAEAKQKEDARLAQEKTRKDRALLDSYSNEKEIDMARDRNLQQTDAAIQSTQTRLKPAQANLDKLRHQLESFTKSKRPIPADLNDDIKDAEKAIAQLNNDIKSKLLEKDAIRARFDADKAHYRELKHLSAESSGKP